MTMLIMRSDFMEVEICVGSSCHLKGSHEVIEKMQSYIAGDALEEMILLKGSFCLGQCMEGVSVRIDGRLVSVSPETAETVIREHWEEKHRAADQL